MKKILNILLLLVGIIFTSCEDVIQVKLDKGAKLLVVDAFITDMRVDQKVRLTHSEPYFSNQNPKAVINATVQLKDLTSNITYNFTNNSNGDYVFVLNPTDTISKVDHAYELTVLYNGDIYKATTTQKRTTSIDSIQVEESGNGPFQQDGYSCTLWARDVPGPVMDYYWIKAFRNDTLFNKGSEINIAIDAANGAGADGLLFTPPIAGGITPFGSAYKLNDKCRVEIHSISRETYYFLVQVINQTTNTGLFATTPENVRTNIIYSNQAKVKAVGWFNMASVSSLEIIVK